MGLARSSYYDEPAGQPIAEARLVDGAHLLGDVPEIQACDDDSVADEIDERAGAERGDELALTDLAVGPTVLG